MLDVCEIFASIQGEGETVGRYCCFIRLSGCNQSCNFCDSKYHTEGIKMTNEEVFDKIKEVSLAKDPYLVITGGEPMLQQDKLEEFFKEYPFFEYEIETNGTILPKKGLLSRLDHYNISPKLSSSGNKSGINIDILKEFAKHKRNSFKFVITDLENDIAEILQILRNLDGYILKTYIMPNGQTTREIQENLPKLIPIAAKYNFLITPRLHVLIWDKKRAV